MPKKIQAILLAGGKGSRLRPFTTVLPKPLMPLGDYPIIEVIIRQLKRCGITNIVISTGHLAGLIEAFLKDGRNFGVNIKYARETKPLGTAGAIRSVKNLAEDFLVINGDVLTNMNFSQFLKEHKKKKCIATIATKERVVKTDFGVIESNKSNMLIDYVEKPQYKSYVSTGMNAFNKKSLKYLKVNEPIGMPEFILKMREAGEKIYCFKTKASWFDLGRFDDFESAQDFFLKHKNKLLPKS